MAVEIVEEKKGRGQGFASRSPEERRRIASMGGKAAQSSGRGHKFTPEELRLGGKNGGSISRRRPKSYYEQLV
jgi:uncharacterized protein